MLLQVQKICLDVNPKSFLEHRNHQKVMVGSSAGASAEGPRRQTPLRLFPTLLSARLALSSSTQSKIAQQTTHKY